MPGRRNHDVQLSCSSLPELFSDHNRSGVIRGLAVRPGVSRPTGKHGSLSGCRGEGTPGNWAGQQRARFIGDRRAENVPINPVDRDPPKREGWRWADNGVVRWKPVMLWATGRLGGSPGGTGRARGFTGSWSQE